MVLHCGQNNSASYATRKHFAAVSLMSAARIAAVAAWLATLFAVSSVFSFPAIGAQSVAAPTTDESNPSTDDFSGFLLNPAEVYGNPAIYEVFRNKKAIGTHSLAFNHENNELVVEVDSKLAVKMLGVTVYKYSYKATEVWSAGELVLLETRINDNRKKQRVIKASSRGQYLLVEDSSKTEPRTMPLPQFGSNHWHPGAILSRRIFHTLHGRLYQGPPEALGWERVVLQGGDVVSARRFRYEAGFNAEVWYDSDWRWIKLSFKADDGSTIEYKCVTCGR